MEDDLSVARRTMKLSAEPFASQCGALYRRTDTSLLPYSVSARVAQ